MNYDLAPTEYNQLNELFQEIGEFEFFPKSEFDKLYNNKLIEEKLPFFTAETYYSFVAPEVLVSDVAELLEERFFFRAPELSEQFYLLASLDQIEEIMEFTCFEDYPAVLELYGLNGETSIRIVKIFSKDDLRWDEEDNFLFSWQVTYRGREAVGYLLNKG